MTAITRPTPTTLDRLEGEGRVAFRYADEVNGSARNIAGILNEAGNVLGMMPHPERMVEAGPWRHRRPAAVRRAAGSGRPARLRPPSAPMPRP